MFTEYRDGPYHREQYSPEAQGVALLSKGGRLAFLDRGAESFRAKLASFGESIKRNEVVQEGPISPNTDSSSRSENHHKYGRLTLPAKDERYRRSLLWLTNSLRAYKRVGNSFRRLTASDFVAKMVYSR